MRSINRTRSVILTAAAVACTALALILAPDVGSAANAEDAQPSVVEDYSYPGADQILSNYHVELISGDGHILFATCPTGPDTVGLIQVRSTNLVGQAGDGRICFRVVTAPGHLTMKIPAVFSIRGDGLAQGQGHKVKAELTTDSGQHSAVDVDPHGTTQVGVGNDPTGSPTTLLQLDAVS